jgi:hypothetical protein
MSKYLNKENFTALAVVVIGVIIATIIAPTVIDWFNKAKAKVAT